MVGIVLVSHSYALAEGAKELSLTMAGSEVKVAAAGGLDMDDHPTGTDPMKILAAIQEVYSDDGVLIFVDMGSALLSSDMARQFLEEEQQKHVIISDAPFIEGAVTAAVQARMNSSLSEILAELKFALQPKQEQLGTAGATSEVETEGQAEQGELASHAGASGDHQLRLQVKNTLGIHARPAAKIATLAASYPELNLWLRKIPSSKKAANCRSLNSITLLGLKQDDIIEFEFSGEGAEEAREAMRALAADGFGDGGKEAAIELSSDDEMWAGLNSESDTRQALDDSSGQNLGQKATGEAGKEAAAEKIKHVCGQAPAGSPHKAPVLQRADSSSTQPVLKQGELKGLCASAGIAVGPAFFLRKASSRLDDLGEYQNLASGEEAKAAHTPDPAAEWQAFQAASETTKEQIRAEKEKIAKANGAKAAAIFDAHLLILEDPVLSDSIKAQIEQEAKTAALAWNVAMRDLEESYQQSESPVIRERAADIRDLRSRLLTILLPEREETGIQGEGILLAEELGPGEVASLDTDHVLGICTVKGSPSSHAAVIARSRGIPAIMGLGSELLNIAEGCELLIDAAEGVLYIGPEQTLVEELQQRKAEEEREAKEAELSRDLPALTKNGRRVEVFANIGGAEDARTAVAKGAEGVGLLRTEFIYLNRTSAPEEEEQVAIYKEIAEALQGRPLTVRTLDAGGDKPLPYLHLPPESNPFLGYRAIRICLKEGELFRTQLRAILRTACDYPLRLMFPMIASLAELRAAKEQVRLAKEELQNRGLPVPADLPLGMMIEIPSAALLAEDFAREVDFFSIGTNDLTQYTLAAERGNQQVSELYSAMNPAVLELIHLTVEGAHKSGIPVAVCGEFAADPQGNKKLVELGVDELSVNPLAIPAVKQRIRRLA